MIDIILVFSHRKSYVTRRCNLFSESTFVFLSESYRDINHPFRAAEGRVESFIYYDQFSRDDADVSYSYAYFYPPIRTAFVLISLYCGLYCTPSKRYLKAVLFYRNPGISASDWGRNDRSCKCESKYTCYIRAREDIKRMYIYIHMC